MSAAKTPAALIRKLHGWELLHLREHCATLEAQVEALTAEVERLRQETAWADGRADMFQDAVLRLQEDGMQLGLTQSGDIVSMPHPHDGDVLSSGMARVAWSKDAPYRGGMGLLNHRWSTCTRGQRVLWAPVRPEYQA
jgi:hypothetical protein